jgi:hypothetical protein
MASAVSAPTRPGNSKLLETLQDDSRRELGSKRAANSC